MSADEFRDYILGFIFYKYLSERMHQYADGILAEDGLKFDAIVESTDEEPLREDVVATMEKAPSVLQRKKVIPRLTEKVKSFVSTFYGGM